MPFASFVAISRQVAGSRSDQKRMADQQRLESLLGDVRQVGSAESGFRDDGESSPVKVAWIHTERIGIMPVNIDVQQQW